MARVVSDVATLREYLRGVIRDANHHARNVDEVVFALAGAVIWAKDQDAPIEVRTRRGGMTKVLWVFIHGQRYAFSYNRRIGGGRIEMRRENERGPALRGFTNRDTGRDVKEFFARLT